jgi:hypothetical protein
MKRVAHDGALTSHLLEQDHPHCLRGGALLPEHTHRQGRHPPPHPRRTEPVWDREWRARRDAFQNAFPHVAHTKSLASSQWWPGGCSSSDDMASSQATTRKAQRETRLVTGIPGWHNGGVPAVWRSGAEEIPQADIRVRLQQEAGGRGKDAQGLPQGSGYTRAPSWNVARAGSGEGTLNCCCAHTHRTTLGCAGLP